jgi:23S rRNA (cytidine1920-2'-O)/16S rRNA (cytidine1409-2'-O)-methyltransferase
MPSPASAKRCRLDQALVDRKLCDSREKAQRAILAGSVRINEQPAHKPSDWVRPEDVLTLLAPEKFVSRGGYKLEHALLTFHVNPLGLSTMDVGASTGGFTDCLLQNGAARVYAIDVGQGQLAWKLRCDPRVVVMEKTNARYLIRKQFDTSFVPVDLMVIDCSFISLKMILPPVLDFVANPGRIIALVKPQFEAGKAEVDRGAGVITDARIHERVVQDLQDFAGKIPHLTWKATTESPLLGPAGNKEFLMLLEKVAS